jgi:hypothetical protein
MDANRLIEEWRQQGRILEVEGANTVLWRMGQGETVICVHGVPTSGFLYRKLLPELASRGLEGVTSLLICRDWVLPIGRPISITAGAGSPRGI